MCGVWCSIIDVWCLAVTLAPAALSCAECAVPAVAGATASVSVRTQGGAANTLYEGDTVSLSCGAGYLPSQTTLTCLGGQLQGTALTCTPVCAAASVATTPADGVAPVISYSATDYVAQTVATATWCVHGAGVPEFMHGRSRKPGFSSPFCSLLLTGELAALLRLAPSCVQC